MDIIMILIRLRGWRARWNIMVSCCVGIALFVVAALVCMLVYYIVVYRLCSTSTGLQELIANSLLRSNQP